MAKAYSAIKRNDRMAFIRKQGDEGSFSFIMPEEEFRYIELMLADLSDLEQKSVVTQALRVAAQRLVTKGKIKFRKSHKINTGNLYRSMSTSLKKRNNISRNASYAGFKRNANKNKNNGGIASGNHAHLIDRGTARRWTKKGAYRGSVSRNNPHKGSNFWTDTVFMEGYRSMSMVTDKLINILIRYGFR